MDPTIINYFLFFSNFIESTSEIEEMEMVENGLRELNELSLDRVIKEKISCFIFSYVAPNKTANIPTTRFYLFLFYDETPHLENGIS